MNRHVPDGLPAAVELARQLMKAGAAYAAARILYHDLEHLDPDHAPAEPVLLAAADLYTQLCADPAWTRYTQRARHHLPPATPGVTQSRTPAPDETDRVISDPPPLPNLLAVRQHCRPADLLDTARGLHRLGRCGEAIRTAAIGTPTVPHQPNAPSRELAAAVAAVMDLAAMLNACGRDTDARTVIAAHARYLPPPGSTERNTFVAEALHLIDDTAAAHEQICARRHDPPWAAMITTGGDDGRTWPTRRDSWWQLLHTAITERRA